VRLDMIYQRGRGNSTGLFALCTDRVLLSEQQRGFTPLLCPIHGLVAANGFLSTPLRATPIANLFAD
jgi:hypothetical protein